MSIVCRPLIILMVFLAPGLLAASLYAQVPELNSNSGARHTLYLDFNGHVEPPQPFRDCGDGNAFRAIPTTTVTETLKPTRWYQALWEEVAEDFAPFDINVTTVEPDELRADNPTADPTGRALRAAIGNSDAGVDALGWATRTCVGKIAYTDPEVPNLVNALAVDSPQDTGTNVSHEVGHLLGLSHFHGPRAEWEQTGRSPIMSYTKKHWNIWYRGANEFNALQDDVALLTSILGQRRYDQPDSASEAEQRPTAYGTRLHDSGVIEQVRDVDFFNFRVTDEGTVRMSLLVGVGGDVNQEPLNNPTNANLRGILEVWTADGSTLLDAVYTPYTHELAAIPPGPERIVIPPSGPVPLRVGEHYRVAVRSYGSYGDLGNYTIVLDGPVSDMGGPRVTEARPMCFGASVGGVRVTFDQPIDPMTVFHSTAWPQGSCECSTLGQLLMLRPVGAPACDAPPLLWHANLSGPSGVVPLSAIQAVDQDDRTPTQFNITFPQQSAVGNYHLIVGPGIRSFGSPLTELINICGYPMNQDGQLPNGQQGHDHFAFSFHVGKSPPKNCID